MPTCGWQKQDRNREKLDTYFLPFRQTYTQHAHVKRKIYTIEKLLEFFFQWPIAKRCTKLWPTTSFSSLFFVCLKDWRWWNLDANFAHAEQSGVNSFSQTNQLIHQRGRERISSSVLLSSFFVVNNNKKIKAHKYVLSYWEPTSIIRNNCK